MDRLQELAVLIAVVDHGSLTAASRRLRRSLPAVTRALASLEQRAGVRLVERTTRRLSVTQAGRAFAERARALLGDYDAALAGLPNTQLRGQLRITAPTQFGRRHVMPLVTTFLAANPDLAVDLLLHDRNLDLIEEEIDLAIRIGPLQDSTLLARRVGEVRRLLVASPDYLTRRGMPEKPRDLVAHDTILGSIRSEPPEWRFGPRTRSNVIRLRPRLLISDAEARLVAAKAGYGIIRVLSYQVVAELRAGSLVRLLPGFEPAALPVNVVARDMKLPKVRAFIDHALPRLLKLPVLQPIAQS